MLWYYLRFLWRSRLIDRCALIFVSRRLRMFFWDWDHRQECLCYVGNVTQAFLLVRCCKVMRTFLSASRQSLIHPPCDPRWYAGYRRSRSVFWRWFLFRECRMPAGFRILCLRVRGRGLFPAQRVYFLQWWICRCWGWRLCRALFLSALQKNLWVRFTTKSGIGMDGEIGGYKWQLATGLYSFADIVTGSAPFVVIKNARDFVIVLHDSATDMILRQFNVGTKT